MVKCVLCALLLASPLLFAETVVETLASAAVQVTDASSGPEVSFSPYAGGEITFSSRSSSVRAQLKLRIFASSAVIQGVNWQAFSFSLPHAYVTIRLLPSKMRLSMGKAPLSWGDGSVYNAADTVNGSRVDSNASDAVLRDQNVWLISYFAPLGTFSFFEAVFSYPQFDIGFLAQFSPDAPSPVIRLLSDKLHPNGYVTGGRVQAKEWGIKWEFSYLYQGRGRDYGEGSENRMHHFPAISAQWHLGINWYASLVYPFPHSLENFHPDTPEVSAGVLYTTSFIRFKGLSLRLETLVKARMWEVYLFPEIIMTPDDLWNLYIRSEWEVRHDEAMIIVGARISPTTGLSLSPFASVQVLQQQFSSFRTGLQFRYIF